jgi:hypothetical protein
VVIPKRSTLTVEKEVPRAQLSWMHGTGRFASTASTIPSAARPVGRRRRCGLRPGRSEGFGRPEAPGEGLVGPPVPKIFAREGTRCNHSAERETSRLLVTTHVGVIGVGGEDVGRVRIATVHWGHSSVLRPFIQQGAPSAADFDTASD